MRIKICSQKIYATIIAYMLSFLSLVTLINGVTNMIGWGSQWDSYVLIAILFAMYLIGFYLLMFENYKLRVDGILVFAVFVSLYLCSVLLYPQNNKYLFTTFTDFLGNPVYTIFFLSLPGYLFARNLENYSYFCAIMSRCAYIVVGLSVIVFFFMTNSFATQYLSFSYNMLLHLLFLIFFQPAKGKLWHKLITSLGAFVFVVGGARGALLSFVLCCMAYIFFTWRQTIKNTVLMIIAGCGVCIFIVMKNEMLALILPLLSKMNINSRTIKMMLAGEMLNSSGRDDIADKLLNNLNIFGHGMMGDRVICSGVYAHNLFLELIIDFGIIFGTVLSIAIITVVVGGVLRKIKQKQVWIILLLSTGFLKLMLSGSYLSLEPAFYVLMGLCVNSFMENRTNDTLIEKNICANKVSP